MNRHIFGFGLFSLIFASFSLVYVFSCAPPIPLQETVKLPIPEAVTREERITSGRMKANRLTYEVLSSEFDLDAGQLMSRIRVTWNGTDERPKQIFLKAQLFTLETRGTSKTLEQLVFPEVFEPRNEATLIVLSDVGQSDKIDERQNLYVVFDISGTDSLGNRSKANEDIAEASQVLFVHKGSKY